MRFITISAAVLLGSAMSAAGAQQLGTASGLKPGATVNTPIFKTGNGSGQIFVTSGGDETCATATPIAGAGLFLGDNTGATLDGSEAPLACSGGVNDNDVWYNWTAAVTGATTVSTCSTGGNPGTASFDTVIRITAGTACQGAEVACNDDFCGSPTWTSRASFAATMGSIYKIQLLGYSAGSEGTYSLSITTPPPVVAPPNDLCGGATAIAGPGNYLGTTVGANFDGPAGSAGCAGSGPIQDVWYDWTATLTGPHQVTTCVGFGGASAFDTIIHAYNGPGCAPVGSLAACDDDGAGVPCPGFQSDMVLNATTGNVYKIRIMGWGAGEEGTYDLRINPPPPPTPLDSCQAPLVYAGGVVPWSNVGMTTDGGAEACGTPSQDIWYVWNATCTGIATLSLCPGGLTPDTVVAVYAGNTCPAAGTAIGCDDDTCSAPAFGSSAASFCATAGQDYMLRIGGFGATTGSGLFEVTGCGPLPAEGTCVVRHDGTSENAIGTGNVTHDILWMHSQGVAGASTVVKSISTAWGTTVGAGGPPNFAPGRIGIWSDPNGDGEPSDAVLIQEQIATVANTNTSTLNVYPLVPPVLVTGKYFIGASCQNATFAAPLDTASFHPCADYAWIVGEVTGAPLDYNNLAGAGIPPTPESAVLPGWYLLESECKDLEIDEICGVVVSAAVECPCAPLGGVVGNGCPHSGAGTGSDGAHLGGSGTALIGAGDTVAVSATNVRQGNGAISLFLQGDNDPSVPFNDGLICSSNNILKLWMWKDPVGPAGSGGGITSQTGPGASTIPATTSISQRSSDLGAPILNGQTRVYTMVFRDPSLTQGCASPSTVNTTNGVRILWSQL